MKYLLPFLLMLVTAGGVEHQASHVLTPSDVGLTKTIFTAKPGNVLVTSMIVERNGVVESDLSTAQANAGSNEIIYFTGSPPWLKGPPLSALRVEPLR